MKKYFLFLVMGLALLGTSCEDIVKSLTVNEEITIPPMSFVIERLQQKDAGLDTLMDETFLLPVDSVMETLDYSYTDLLDYLGSMKVKKMFFQLADSSDVHTFNFIDSARLTFSTQNIPEVTVAHLVARENREARPVLDLSLDLTDVTKMVKSRDSIRARIYGRVNMDSLPASVQNLEVLVGGRMGMELKPKL